MRTYSHFVYTFTMYESTNEMGSGPQKGDQSYQEFTGTLNVSELATDGHICPCQYPLKEILDGAKIKEITRGSEPQALNEFVGRWRQRVIMTRGDDCVKGLLSPAERPEQHSRNAQIADIDSRSRTACSNCSSQSNRSGEGSTASS